MHAVRFSGIQEIQQNLVNAALYAKEAWQNKNTPVALANEEGNRARMHAYLGAAACDQAFPEFARRVGQGEFDLITRSVPVILPPQMHIRDEFQMGLKLRPETFSPKEELSPDYYSAVDVALTDVFQLQGSPHHNWNLAFREEGPEPVVAYFLDAVHETMLKVHNQVRDSKSPLAEPLRKARLVDLTTMFLRGLRDQLLPKTL